MQEQKNVSVDMPDPRHRVSVVIPSYQPDEKLCRFVGELEEAGFDDILVIDDGSSEDKKRFFPDPAEHPAVTMLVHPVNRGKGAALKTAFEYFIANRPGREGVVTADGDAQHRVRDVYSCSARMLACPGRDTMVLGVRDFNLPGVPKRSRAGNHTTSAVFLILCGLKISDTQTGLRSTPSQFVPALSRIEGDRYEYETNTLLALKSIGLRFCEEPIETVYIEENQTSHFRPVRDSIRIYSLILRFVFSSAAATLIDLAVFYLMCRFVGERFGVYQELVCTAAARVVSSAANFYINRRIVFHSGEPMWKTFVKYYLLAIPVMFISASSVSLLKSLVQTTAPWLITLIKMCVDTVLYFINFRIQREWVFARNRTGKKPESK